MLTSSACCRQLVILLFTQSCSNLQKLDNQNGVAIYADQFSRLNDSILFGKN
jgi:hypothetical protein